jgi:hypothetical protein
MLVAAAVCPHPPLLMTEAMGAAGGRGEGGMDEVLAACDEAVAGLKAAGPDVIVVVGGAEAGAVYDGPVAGSLAEYGVRVGVGTGPTVLPLSLTVGLWLLIRAGLVAAGSQSTPQVLLRAVDRAAPVAECLRLGAELAQRAGRVAMLVMGDGSARKAVGVPGAPDPGAEGYDAEVAAALAAADPARLARLAPGLDEELIVAGRAAWQVLAGAANGRRLQGQLRCAVAPFGVGYLVASWDVAG